MREFKAKKEERVNPIATERRSMEAEFRGGSPVYNRMVEQISEVFGEPQVKGGLNQTERILIALGMAVQNGTPSSIDWTITRALNHGATEQMIRETIDIALLNGGTFVVANARFALTTMANVLQAISTGTQEHSSGEFGPISLPGSLGYAVNS
jgi:alkylhydroperoxidase/carboxymuconolactone decarboxylase family protein YurZ